MNNSKEIHLFRDTSLEDKKSNEVAESATKPSFIEETTIKKIEMTAKEFKTNYQALGTGNEKIKFLSVACEQATKIQRQYYIIKNEEERNLFLEKLFKHCFGLLLATSGQSKFANELVNMGTKAIKETIGLR